MRFQPSAMMGIRFFLFKLSESTEFHSGAKQAIFARFLRVFGFLVQNKNQKPK